MIKNISVLFAAAACLAIASCDSPSDYRPSRKVSVDSVPPGERNTFNVSDAGDEANKNTDTHNDHGTTFDSHQEDAQPNETLIDSDQHTGGLDAAEGDTEGDEAEKANVADSIDVQ